MIWDANSYNSRGQLISSTFQGVVLGYTRPSEISIETIAAAKCAGIGLSDPCLWSAATSFGSQIETQNNGLKT